MIHARTVSPVPANQIRFRKHELYPSTKFQWRRIIPRRYYSHQKTIALSKTCHLSNCFLFFRVKYFFNKLEPLLETIDVKFIPALDHVHYNIKQHFEETYHYIAEKLNQKINVLVHCHAGISRSASIVIAFLMRNKSISLEEAFKIVKSKRPRIKPNEAFIKQLV